MAALGATGIVALGLADDITQLGPWTKLIAGALLAALVVRSGWSINLTGVSLIDQAATVAWIVFFQNAFNALDGLDGLAPGVGFLGFVCLGSWFLVSGDSWSATVAWSLGGATLAFLAYNFPPSRGIFLGDSGSQFLGFALALLVVRAMVPGADQGTARGVSVVPLFFVWVPLTEAVFVIWRRLRRRVSPLRGDRLHLYDELYRRLGSMRKVALAYYAATAVVAGCAWWVLAGRQL
jgi:UDP-GlcNAc:undecaprenyl-phosphate GlcNAc-1-phosphate transferase